MFSLIETMRLEHGKVKRLDYHESRIHEAVRHFNFKPLNFKEEIRRYVDENNLHDGLYRLRAEYNNSLTITHDTLKDTTEINANLLQIKRVDNKFLEYKTTVRDQYITTDCPFALYYDEENRITEFNIGNVVIKDSSGYFTPSTGGLLNGVMRQSLIDNGNIKVRDYNLEEFVELYQDEKIEIYLVNSLREWVKVNLQV